MSPALASPENNYHYNKALRFHARELRRTMTKAEKVLWRMLRKQTIYHQTFLRQRPVLEYIADFMCKELLLIVEADGITHETELCILKDEHRDNELRKVGFTVLRYKDWEILSKPEEVFQEIREWVEIRINENDIHGSKSGDHPPVLPQGR